MNTRSVDKRSALKELPIPENILAPPRGATKPNTKKKLKVIKTSSFVESFPGRLDWKRRHFEKPVTSTPTTTSLKSVFTQDVDKCFGFDEDSDREENYSSLISPIPKTVDHLPDRIGKDIYLNDKAQAKPATRSSERSSSVKENPPASLNYCKPTTTKITSNFGKTGNFKEEIPDPPSFCEPTNSNKTSNVKNDLPIPPSTCESTMVTRNSGKASKTKDLPAPPSACKPTKITRNSGKTSKVKEDMPATSSSCKPTRITRNSGKTSKAKEDIPATSSSCKPTMITRNSGKASKAKEDMPATSSSCKPTMITRNSGKASKVKDLPATASTYKPTKPARAYGKKSKVKEVAPVGFSTQAKNVPSGKEDVPVIATPSSKLANLAVATASKTNKLFESIKSTCKIPLKSRFKGKAGKKKVVIRQPDFDSSVQLDEASEPYMVLQPTDIGDDGVKVHNFAELLERYNFDEKEEEEFRIDPKRFTVTYPGKRNSDDVQCFDFELPTKKRKTKTFKSKKGTKKTKGFVPQPSKRGKGNKKDGDELDAATREWLEKKNKEFQDILKVNLIVE